jgi:hypothetical protein
MHAPDIGAVFKGFPLMKVLVTPPLPAANVAAYLNARVLARLLRIRLAARVEPEDAQARDRIHHAGTSESTNASFWILHAR